MKTRFCAMWLAFSLFLPAIAVAAPIQLALQGVLQTVGGGAVADGNYGMVIALYPKQNSTVDEAFWSEAIITVPVKGGLFALTLGAALKNPIDSGAFLANLDAYLGVTVGADPELPRAKMVRVAYAALAHEALHAGVADSLGPNGLAPGSVTADKIAFTYAGSAAKGGPAIAALALQCSGCIDSDQLADGAITAAKANFNYAGSAAKGGSATTAENSKDLQCTGCVGSADIADAAVIGVKIADLAVASAKLADLAVTTGKVADLAITSPKLADGAVTTAKIADGAVTAAKISSFAFPVADVAPFACDGSHVGWAYVSKVDSTLNVCNGDTFGAVSIGKIGSQQSPGVSCAQILQKQIGAKDGVYWLDVDGAGPLAPFQTGCNMADDAGGWTLVARVSTEDADNWVYTNVNWTNNGAFGADAANVHADFKSAAYSQMPLSKIMIKTSKNGIAEAFKSYNTASGFTSFLSAITGNCVQAGISVAASNGVPHVNDPVLNGSALYLSCTNVENNNDSFRIAGYPGTPAFWGGDAVAGVGLCGDSCNNYNSDARPKAGQWYCNNGSNQYYGADNKCYPNMAALPGQNSLGNYSFDVYVK